MNSLCYGFRKCTFFFFYITNNEVKILSNFRPTKDWAFSRSIFYYIEERYSDAHSNNIISLKSYAICFMWERIPMLLRHLQSQSLWFEIIHWQRQRIVSTRAAVTNMTKFIVSSGFTQTCIIVTRNLLLESINSFKM